MIGFIRFIGRASALCFILCCLVIVAMILFAVAGYDLKAIRGVVILCFDVMGVSTVLMFIASKLK